MIEKHPNADVIEVLQKVRELLDGPEKNAACYAPAIECHAFNEGGYPVDDLDAAAVRWSVVGALAKLGMPRVMPWIVGKAPEGLGTQRDSRVFDKAFGFLYAAAAVQGPYTINGISNRSWDSARDLLLFAELLATEQVVIASQPIVTTGRQPSLELQRKFE